MRIGIDMGHTLTGAGTGASGFAKETDKNREVGKRLIQMLKDKGHTVINCTINQSANDLRDRVAIANESNLDLYISLHLNASNGKGHGVETYVYNGSFSNKAQLKAKAKVINDALSVSVGWFNRGVKEADYYVLRETKCPAILCELGFCDNEEDMSKWNTEKLAAALFKGITGQVYETVKPKNSKTMYRVVVGSYADKTNAEAQQNKLRVKGFDSFLMAYKQ